MIAENFHGLPLNGTLACSESKVWICPEKLIILPFNKGIQHSFDDLLQMFVCMTRCFVESYLNGLSFKCSSLCALRLGTSANSLAHSMHW